MYDWVFTVRRKKREGINNKGNNNNNSRILWRRVGVYSKSNGSEKKKNHKNMGVYR